ncbi:hypothetical protein OHT93_33735 [Streptomyces sp. NBC_00191]|uniref:hypothetical protein n=1 Tax=unclassified Streptomyces TaxID=2593676 RepID=UPI003253D811
MDLINPTVTASRDAQNRWTLTVKAIETFTPEEIRSGFEFEDWAQWWEWDDSDHDHLANHGVIRWRPASVREAMEWTWSNIPGDDLDTELGGEEIRAKLFIRNFTTSSAPIERLSPILEIAPD